MNDVTNTIEFVRLMEPEDLPQVMLIERASYQFPWSEQIFTDCMRVGYLCLVITTDESLVGYAIASSAAGEAHILNLCVAKHSRREGRARALIEQAVASVMVSGAQVVFLEVRPSNVAATRLYARSGFQEVGRRADYYKAPDGREDAIVMSRQLVSAMP